jgi:hypothetical protein
MQHMIRKVLGLVVMVVLAGCAGRTEQLTLQSPMGQSPETVTFPNGTVFGGASGREASALAEIMADANNNNMQEFGKLESAETKNLQTSQQALAMLEQLSKEQGTGEITLFFPIGATRLPLQSEDHRRLVTFLDQLSPDSRGRKVLFVMIGSASAIGDRRLNERLSRERAEAPEPIIDQYLVNVPHQFFKVYGLGDTYSPKHVSLTEDQRYQNVRIIAVYDTDQVPPLPQGPKA